MLCFAPTNTMWCRQHLLSLSASSGDAKTLCRNVNRRNVDNSQQSYPSMRCTSVLSVQCLNADWRLHTLLMPFIYEKRMESGKLRWRECVWLGRSYSEWACRLCSTPNTNCSPCYAYAGSLARAMGIRLERSRCFVVCRHPGGMCCLRVVHWPYKHRRRCVVVGFFFFSSLLLRSRVCVYLASGSSQQSHQRVLIK